MGLSSFPVVSSGWLPILVINAALSIAVIKDIWRSVLRMVGLRGNGEEESMESSSAWSYAETPVLECGLAESSATVEEIRESLPVARFECSAAAGNGNTECAVCLSKFNGGDEIRRLPCFHLFHKACLDKWLDHDRMTCPLCRLCLVPEQMRTREQHLTEELIVWFSSFQGTGF